MASEVEVRLEKKIERLQAQINALSSELRKLYRVVTHPSTKTYIQKYSVLKTEVGDLVGTANQIVVDNGVDCLAKNEDVTLSLPAAVTGKLVTNGDSHDHVGGDGNSINLTTAVTGILPSTNGGTGNGFTKFSGPTTAEKTFTLPNANAVLATVSGVTVVSTGVGTVKMGSANPADNAGWLAITNHLGVIVYVPYWTDETP